MKNMTYPVRENVDYQHHFNEIEKRVESIKDLMGPVYSVEHQNVFQSILQQVQDLKTLNYPVYDIQRDHRFAEIQKNLYDIKMMNGPVYHTEHQHNFNYIDNIIVDLKSLQGPVYSIENAISLMKLNKKLKLSNITSQMVMSLPSVERGERSRSSWLPSTSRRKRRSQIT